jgi:hypothetical protein
MGRADETIPTRSASRRSVLADGVNAADVMEHPEAFDHVGLLANELPGQTGLLFL